MSLIADPPSIGGKTGAVVLSLPRVHTAWCLGCLDQTDRAEMLRLVGMGVLKVVRRPGELPVFQAADGAEECCQAHEAHISTTA